MKTYNSTALARAAKTSVSSVPDILARFGIRPVRQTISTGQRRMDWGPDALHTIKKWRADVDAKRAAVAKQDKAAAAITREQSVAAMATEAYGGEAFAYNGAHEERPTGPMVTETATAAPHAEPRTSENEDMVRIQFQLNKLQQSNDRLMAMMGQFIEVWGIQQPALAATDD